MMGDGKEDMASEAKSNSFTITLKTPKEKVDFSVEPELLIKDVRLANYNSSLFNRIVCT